MQIIDLGDGGSSVEESTESNEATKEALKKLIDVAKGKEAFKLISPLSQVPFFSYKALTSMKKRKLSVDILGTIGKVLGMDLWLESTLD